MAENPLAAATNMKPRTLMLVVGGGVVAGVAWRMWSNRSGGNRVLPDAVTATDDDYLDLGFAGEGAYAGSGSDRRDVFGQGINLPVSEWIIRDGQGNRFLTDGTNITPLDGTPNTPTTPTTPSPGTYVPSGQPTPVTTTPKGTVVPMVAKPTHRYQWEDAVGVRHTVEGGQPRAYIDALNAGRWTKMTKL